MKIIFLFFVTNLIGISTFAQPLTEQLDPAFKAFQGGQFELAKELFLKLLETNNNNSFILYNLGLAEYKLGNIGRALGLWSRALNIDPELKEARTAVEYAKEKLSPRPEEPDLDTVFDIMQYKILPYTSIHLVFFFCLITLFLFWRGLFSSLVARRQAAAEKVTPPPISNFVFVWAALFLLSTTYGAFKAYDDSLSKGIVVTQKAEAKTGPNAEQVTLFTVTEGTSVIIKEKANDWYKIESPKLKLGWVPVENIYITTDN